jgi:hypothetical protein
MSGTPTGTTFKPGGRYDQRQTLTTGVLARSLTPLDEYKVGFLRGFRDGARDLSADKVRVTFGSFAVTAYAAGYRAAIQAAGEKR